MIKAHRAAVSLVVCENAQLGARHSVGTGKREISSLPSFLLPPFVTKMESISLGSQTGAGVKLSLWTLAMSAAHQPH